MNDTIHGKYRSIACTFGKSIGSNAVVRYNFQKVQEVSRYFDTIFRKYRSIAILPIQYSNCIGNSNTDTFQKYRYRVSRYCIGAQLWLKDNSARIAVRA